MVALVLYSKLGVVLSILQGLFIITLLEKKHNI